MGIFMKDPIAIDKVLVQLPNEPLREVTIQVWRPFKDPEYPDEWLCPASLEPLHSNLLPARSNSAFQSLCLANARVLNLLHEVVEKGGSVWLEPGASFPFEAYAFGVAVSLPDSYSR